MLRLAGFFVLVLLALQVLRWVPVVGPLFRNSFVGFWIAAILVSAIVSRLAARAVDRGRLARRRRELGAVETAHNQGKLGALMLASGEARGAIEPLSKAVVGEPQSVEWRYRLGSALLAAGRFEEAVDELERAVAIREEHAYGALMLRLVEALEKCGRRERALEVLERFERNHGPSPESAYRGGVLLRALGRRDEARESFRRVSTLAAHAAAFQKHGSRSWAARAFLARIF